MQRIKRIIHNPSPSNLLHRTFFNSFKPTNPSQLQRNFTPIKLYPVLQTPRNVPDSILKPPYITNPYYDPRSSQNRDLPEIKDSVKIQKMRTACKFASMIREYAGQCCIAGRTTEEVDRLVHEYVISLGIYPSPLGYAQFPKSLCTSINEVICHGIPGKIQALYCT